MSGARIFAALELPGDLTVLGERVEKKLYVQTSHQPGSSLRATLGPVRFYCTYQLGGIFGSAGTVSVRHTGDVEANIEAARRVLGLAEESWQRLDATAERMAALRLSRGRLEAFLEVLWPTGDAELSERTVRGRERVHAAVLELHAADYNADIAGTAWGAWNAVVEYLDWGRRRPRDGDLFRRNLDETSLKGRAAEVLVAMAA